MGTLSRFATPLLLYAALLADVALRSMTNEAWLPNLLLLAAFSVVRSPAGIVWCAGAGLICDGISDRPLGVTMLAATLTATIYREVTRDDAQSAGWSLVKTFVFLAMIECSARVVAETVSATPDPALAAAIGLQTTFASAAIAAVLILCQRLARGRSKPRAAVLPGRWSLGRIR
jgi:cell shape-determining protein MreD